MDLRELGTLMDDPDLRTRMRAACAIHGVGANDVVLVKVAQAVLQTETTNEAVVDQAILDAVAEFSKVD